MTTKYYCLLLMLLIAPSAIAQNRFYWVGNGGSWSDFQNHWSTTSGGLPDALASPSVNDTAYFDANSFNSPNQVVSGVDAIALSRLDFRGVSFSPTVTGTSLYLSGSLFLSPGMNWDTTMFLGLSSTNTQPEFLFTAGVQLGDIKIGSLNTAEYILGGPLQSVGELRVVSGKFNTAGYAMSVNQIWMTNDLSNMEVELHNSVIKTSRWTSNGGFNNFPMLMHADDATIIIRDSLNNGVFEEGNNGKTTYGTVILQNYTLFNLDTVLFKKLECQTAAEFVIGNSVSIDSLVIDTNAFFHLSIRIDINKALISLATPGKPAIITGNPGLNCGFFKAEGDICLHDMQMLDVVISGGVHFFAGSSSLDMGGNIGVTFDDCGNTPAGYYWVNNSGNWNDPSHWATSSGGNVFHTSAPGSNDDIYIDQNSFTIPGQSLTINMIATGRNLYFNPTVEFDINSIGFSTDFNGSLFLNDKVKWSEFQNLRFQGNLHSVIKTGGCLLGNTVVLGKYCEMLDDINVRDTLAFISNIGGTGLITNNFTISCNNLSIGCYADLGRSTIYSETASFADAGNCPSKYYENSIVVLSGTNILFNSYNTHQFGKIFFNGDGTIEIGDYKIHKLIVDGNAFLNTDIELDTLVLNNPGDTLKLGTSTTTTINNRIECHNLPGDLVTILTDGGLALISKSTGDVCLHDVALHFITANGGAQFYADTSCIDLGGNTGWQFTPCSVVSDVWPGDANYDGIVTNYDLLNIGIAFNAAGPIRSAASLQYVAQPAVDWNNYFLSGTNYKHADTNGDGVVDASDTTAIIQNYGLPHPLRLSSSVTGTPLYMELSKDSVNTGDTVIVDFYLGTPTNPANDIYGLAFSLNFNNSLIDSTYTYFDYASSWLGNSGGNLLAIQKPLFSQGKMDFALVRTDQNNISGSGWIGQCGIVIVDNIGVRISTPLVLDNAFGIDFTGYVMPITVSSDTLSIDSIVTNAGIVIERINFIIYPNPSSGNVYIKSFTVVENVLITDLNGKVVFNEAFNILNPVIITELKNGLYILKIQSAGALKTTLLEITGR